MISEVTEFVLERVSSTPGLIGLLLASAVFAAEERGLLGSYYYATNPSRPIPGTRAVINFDMIGRNETPSDQTKGLIEIAADTSNELNLVGANPQAPVADRGSSLAWTNATRWANSSV